MLIQEPCLGDIFRCHFLVCFSSLLAKATHTYILNDVKVSTFKGTKIKLSFVHAKKFEGDFNMKSHGCQKYESHCSG